MLNTIDKIDKKIKNEIPTNINATFNLLEMNEFNLGDELYMRMNTRGLALTDFENFKSWLEAHCEKYTDNEYFNYCDSEEKKKNHWTQKIDREWTNLIWDLSDKGANKDSDKSKKENKFDEMFMLFFRGMAQFAIANTDEGEFPEEKEAKNLIAEFSDMNKFISIEQYKKYFNKNILDDCFKFLDFVCNKDNCKHLDGFYFEGDKNLFNRFLKEQTYDDKVLFYALIQYLKKNDWKINDNDNYKSNYNRYKRIIRNFVENTNILNENFIKAIKSINDLAVMTNSLLEKIKNSDIKFFDKKQVEEEKLKAELIIKNKEDKSWEDLIIEAENHALFRGRIAFLLKKLENEKLENLSGEDIELFTRNWGIADELWDINGSKIEKNQYLIIRAILSKCNEIPLGKVYLSNGNNWKSLFERKDIQKGLTKLFSGKNEVESIKDYLENNIRQYNNQKKGWMYNIIKFGNVLLGYSKTQKIQRYYGHEIYLYEKTNACEGDILISDISAKRNKIIDTLLASNFIIDCDWRRVEINDNLNFYKGHDIILNFEDKKKIILTDSKIVIQELDIQTQSFRNIKNAEKELENFAIEELPNFILVN